MFKGFTTEVAVDVGKSGAILLNQIYQWFKSGSRTKMFRTNAELSMDLGGILSVATIQRAKTALVEKGYITITFDKGYKRTTHYQLTEKAKKALAGVAEVVEVAKEVAKEAVKKVVKGVVKYPKNDQPSGNPNADTNSMKESFKEGMTNKKAIPCPVDVLKGMLKRKVEKSVEKVVDEPQTYPDDQHLFVKREVPLVERVQDISDEEFFSNPLNLGLSYNTIPNVEIRNQNLYDIDNMKNFREDW